MLGRNGAETVPYSCKTIYPGMRMTGFGGAILLRRILRPKQPIRGYRNAKVILLSTDPLTPTLSRLRAREG
ncbi:MAG: hypothetical protein ACYC27_09180 [Armatimonadota bacterium]